MPISIPTSIGGISIPGLAVNGPLGALFKSKFGRQDLSYPRDLQSATRGHFIQFNIQEIDPATFDNVYNSLSGLAANIGIKAAEDAIASAADTIKTIAQAENSIKALFNTGQQAFDTGVKKVIGFSKPKLRSVGTISLYIPETVNFTYNANYDGVTIADAVQKIGGKPAEFVVKGILSSPARLLLKGQGYAFNPQEQILFKGIDFRTYTMAFIFTPYSKQEAEEVEKIIKQFKFHAAPRLAGGSGMFFIPPSIFTPKFFFNGRENKKINKITDSVITSIDVNYAPNGFSSTSDGGATQIALTISFKEIELITRDKIEQGY
jgi:hypothetical protein